MIVLAMIVCMVDQPTRCKDVQLVFEGERVTAQQCQLNSMLAMSAWVGEHPNWVIKKFTCLDGTSIAERGEDL